MAVKIGLIGNGQVRTYAALLKASNLDVDLDVMDFSLPYSREEVNRKLFLERVSGMDHVLCMENGLSFTRFSDLADAHGQQKIVRICDFVFRGMFPDVCYVTDTGRPAGFNDYNSVIILGCFLRGFSVEHCLELFNIETFAALGLFSAWNDSLDYLRYQDSQIDVPAAALVEQCVKTYPCFYTMTHPNDQLLGEYLTLAMQHVGIACRFSQEWPTADPLHFIEMPVHDFVAARLGLPYRTPQYMRIYNTFVDLETFIRKNYESYAECDRSKLVVSHSPALKRAVDQHDPTWLTGGLAPEMTPV